MLNLLQELGFIEIRREDEKIQIRLTNKGSAECEKLPRIIVEDVPMV
jgi:DNA-binding PadR family transcriptional regulator